MLWRRHQLTALSVGYEEPGHLQDLQRSWTRSWGLVSPVADSTGWPPQKSADSGCLSLHCLLPAASPGSLLSRLTEPPRHLEKL